MHAALCRAGDGLFDIAVLHLLGFYEQGVMGAGDEGGEIAARVNGADDQVGIVKLRCRAVPVSVEDVDDCSHIAWIRINDVIFAVAEAATATAAAQGRTGEVRGHDEGCAAGDDHTHCAKSDFPKFSREMSYFSAICASSMLRCLFDRPPGFLSLRICKPLDLAIIPCHVRRRNACCIVFAGSVGSM